MAGMSDADVQGQIAHMIAFIDQEATEKVEEINAKAEEEFNIEKGRFVQIQRSKILEVFEKKQKTVELQKKIMNSNMLNSSRLKVLKKKEEYVNDLLEDMRKKMALIVKEDPTKYRNMLKKLTLQGLVKLMEPKVTVHCKQEDIKVLKESVSEIQSQYKEIMKGKYEVVLTVDEQQFLGRDVTGGVVLTALNGKITVINTLEERLNLVSQNMMPMIREMLFGTNPNRRFKD